MKLFRFDAEVGQSLTARATMLFFPASFRTIELQAGAYRLMHVQLNGVIWITSGGEATVVLGRSR